MSTLSRRSLLAGSTATLILLTGSPIAEATPQNASKVRVYKSLIQKVTGYKPSKITIKTATDTVGHNFDVIETGALGYYIVNPDEAVLEEYSKSAPSPFLNSSSQDNLIYLGPTYYFTTTSTGKWKHTVRTSTVVDPVDETDIATKMTDHIAKSRKTKTKGLTEALTTGDGSLIQTLSTSGPTYILNSGNVEYAKYPPNRTGDCGCTAATIVLYWWNRRASDTISPTYLESDGTLRLTGFTLKDQLKQLGDCYNSWGASIAGLLNKYNTNRGIFAGTAYFVSNLWIYEEITVNRRPVIAFGSFWKAGAHAITVYGLNSDGTYMTQYGWGDFDSNGSWVDYYRHVNLNLTWVASTTQYSR